MIDDYIPFDRVFLACKVNCIVNEVRGIDRVSCDFTSRPPGANERA